MSPETEVETITGADVGVLSAGIVDTPTPPPADDLHRITGQPKAMRSMEWLTRRTNRLLYRMEVYLQRMEAARALYDECAKELPLVKLELDEAFVAAQAALNAPVPKRAPKEGDVTIDVPTGDLRASSEG